MAIKQFLVQWRVMLQCIQNLWLQGRVGQHGTEGHMQQLPSRYLIQKHSLLFRPAEFRQGPDLRFRRENMIAVPIGRKTAAAKLDNFVEQGCRCPSHDAQGFEIAGARRFYVEQLTTHAPDDCVRHELIRTAMNAYLVRAAMLRDGDMVAQRGLEFLQVALVVDALFKISDKPRRDADYIRDFVPAKFQADKEMLQRAGRILGFIHAHLDLERALSHDFCDVGTHEATVFERATIFDRGALQCPAVELQHPKARDLELPP